MQQSSNHNLFTWRATLDIDVLSLFRQDNRSQLVMAREAWKQLRQRDPEATVFTEEMEIPMIVTLADPPKGTPSDNQLLFELNAPRLHESCTQWEEIMDRPFEWLIDLDA